MVRQLTRCCLLPALLALLGACSGSKQAEPDPNIVPAGYKQEILLLLKSSLEDATNIRDAYISDPTITKVGGDQRYTACVRFNARDANHRYIGSRDRIAYFYAGHLNQLVAATPEQCGNAAYKPFPEAEKLCQARECN